MGNVSTFTGIQPYLIAERSEATPGLFNNLASIISQNLDQLNTDTFALSAAAPPGALNAASVPGSGITQIQAAINKASALGIPIVYLPTNLLPYNASQISFINTVQMVREGGDWSVFDVQAYGAFLDGVTDDSSAWSNCIAGAAQFKNRGTVRCSAGTTVATFKYPAGSQVHIVGAGLNSTFIVCPTTASSVISAAHSHLKVEYGCSLQGVTIDGNNRHGPAVWLGRVTLFEFRGCRLYNAAGAQLQLESCWDTTGYHLYINPTSNATAVVFSTNTFEACTENRFFSFHIEGDSGTAPLMYMNGSNGQVCQLNDFYYPKLHGNTTNANPTAPLLSIDTLAPHNKFFGGEMFYARTVPQVVVAGSDTLFHGIFHGGDAANPPSSMYSILPSTNDTAIIDVHTNLTGWTAPLIDIGASASRTKVRHLVWPSGVTNIIRDNGFETDAQFSVTRTGVTYSASMTPDAALGTTFSITVTNGTAMTVNNPLNLSNGKILTLDFYNNSGGAMGAVTFGANYKLAGAFVAPATGFHRLYTFMWNTAALYEVARSSADIAN